MQHCARTCFELKLGIFISLPPLKVEPPMLPSTCRWPQVAVVWWWPSYAIISIVHHGKSGGTPKVIPAQIPVRLWLLYSCTSSRLVDGCQCFLKDLLCREGLFSRLIGVGQQHGGLWALPQVRGAQLAQDSHGLAVISLLHSNPGLGHRQISQSSTITIDLGVTFSLLGQCTGHPQLSMMEAFLTQLGPNLVGIQLPQAPRGSHFSRWQLAIRLHLRRNFCLVEGAYHGWVMSL